MSIFRELFESFDDVFNNGFDTSKMTLVNETTFTKNGKTYIKSTYTSDDGVKYVSVEISNNKPKRSIIDLNWELHNAVQDENYELAAKLQKEIKNFKSAPIELVEIDRYRDGGTIIYKDANDNKYYYWSPSNTYFLDNEKTIPIKNGEFKIVKKVN